MGTNYYILVKYPNGKTVQGPHIGKLSCMKEGHRFVWAICKSELEGFPPNAKTIIDEYGYKLTTKEFLDLFDTVYDESTEKIGREFC